MNAAEYQEKALKHIKVAGTGFAIHGKPRPEEQRSNEAAADAWFCYLARVGLTDLAKTWRYILDGLSRSITVPCERPELFDLGYVPPTRIPSWRGIGTYRRDAMPAVRKASAAAVRGMWHIGVGATPPEMNQAEPNKPDYSSIKLSDEAKSIFRQAAE